ncbi:MAG: Ogr/Delta-like zinc finger [Clostridia bacterium]|nr:Ogr/Delta-like zinc finger [Clostridia bacterium]
MNCPKCGKKLRVIDSKPISNQLRHRRYICKECKLRIYTKETIIYKKYIEG